MEQLKTMNIKGKEYVTVDVRLGAFRDAYPDWSIETDIIYASEDAVTTRTIIKNENGRVIGTGLAHEERDDKSQMCNKTSFYEVCETSSIGRAIAIATNIGNIGSIASADEVVHAIAKQEPQKAVSKPSEEITLDYAKTYKTTKGILYKDLKDEQLQFIIDSDKSSAKSKECAKLVLLDRREDLTPIEVELEDGDLPF